MRKKLIGILLILLAALVIVQDYFIKWEISIWMLAWVVLLAILSLSSLLKRHFGLGFAYGIVALFSLNGQFHFLPVSNSVLIFSSILSDFLHKVQILFPDPEIRKDRACADDNCKDTVNICYRRPVSIPLPLVACNIHPKRRRAVIADCDAGKFAQQKRGECDAAVDDDSKSSVYQKISCITHNACHNRQAPDRKHCEPHGLLRRKSRKDQVIQRFLVKGICRIRLSQRTDHLPPSGFPPYIRKHKQYRNHT